MCSFPVLTVRAEFVVTGDRERCDAPLVGEAGRGLARDFKELSLSHEKKVISDTYTRGVSLFFINTLVSNTNFG